MLLCVCWLTLHESVLHAGVFALCALYDMYCYHMYCYHMHCTSSTVLLQYLLFKAV